MNLWQCDDPGCKAQAIGVGGAIGLVAIGWVVIEGGGFMEGPKLLCPAHRPIPEDGLLTARMVQAVFRFISNLTAARGVSN